jgi:radical SAM protein with 4Fe4S-binding SPASM domain
MIPLNRRSYWKKTQGYIKAFAGFLTHSDHAYGEPTSCFIEPTNLCNLHCPLCTAGSGALNRPRGFLGMNQFERILERLPEGITDLYLWGQGEPFMTPDFLPMVKSASGRGFRTVVSTNGHFLHPPKDIIDSGLDTLIISLDGADRETYESYRIGGSFDQVIEGIRGLTKTIDKVKSDLKIELQCVINNRNEKNLYQFKTLAESLGLKKTVFKTLQAASLSGDGSMDFMIPADQRLTRYRKKKCGDNIILETDRSWMLRNRCLRLYYSFQVDWEGNVLPCCFDKNSEYLMGNILNDPFGKIWNGEKYRSFRNMLNNRGRSLPMCHDCTEGLRRMYVHV